MNHPGSKWEVSFTHVSSKPGPHLTNPVAQTDDCQASQEYVKATSAASDMLQSYTTTCRAGFRQKSIVLGDGLLVWVAVRWEPKMLIRFLLPSYAHIK